MNKHEIMSISCQVFLLTLLIAPTTTLAVNGNTFLGDGAGTSNITGQDNTFIGENTGLSNTHGSGNVFIGSMAGSESLSGGGNTFIGLFSGNKNTTGHTNAFLGASSGRNNTTGHQNTFIGNLAGNDNTSGNNNTFVGLSSGENNINGTANAFFGLHSGYANISGQFNTFLGLSAGEENTIGNDNTFVGASAGSGNSAGLENAFFGYHAGIGNETGNGNSIFGANSGLSNEVGSQNVFVGNESGLRSEGSSNVFIGYRAGYFELGDNKLYIENSDSSSPLIYGDFATNEITINSTLKTTTLCLSSDCRTAWPNGSGSSPWSELSGNVYRLTGNVGIGTNSPDHILDVITPNANKFYINNQGADFSSYESAFEGIDGETALNSFAQTGSSFSLAAIANTFPNVVETENDLSYVNYEYLVPYLIEAIKAQNIRIDELEAAVGSIGGENEPITIQAENANVITGGVTVDNNNAGFNGAGFTNFSINNGYIEFQNVEGGAGGAAILRIRRALGVGNRTGSISINGSSQAYTCTSTGSWTNYTTTDVAILLSPGETNTIRFSSTGSDFCNIDEITVLY